MKFSSKLNETKALCETYNLGVVMRMEAILNEAPNLCGAKGYRSANDVCHIEMDGNLFGERGTWQFNFAFDENSDISGFVISFSEDKSSSKPFADTYTVSMKALAENMKTAPTPYKLMEVKISRVNNYRFSHSGSDFTAKEIAEISKPELIARSSIHIRNAKTAYIEESIKTKHGLRTIAKEKAFAYETVSVM